jgi:hypothetical protein
MRKRSADTNGIHIRPRDELLRAIDEFRRSEPDLPSRPKAALQLLQQALMARQRHAGKRGADDVECRLAHTAA